MRTPICDELGIEFPIFAFTHCRDVVVAVSKAGGFGVLGAVGFSPEQLEVECRWIDEHVGDKPYGVDIVMPAKYMGKGGGAEASIESLSSMIPTCRGRPCGPNAMPTAASRTSRRSGSRSPRSPSTSR